MKIKVGIIGGSGLNNPDFFKADKEEDISTPYGSPSDKLRFGQISGVDCVLLARHGRNHTIMPSKVNFRANIWALHKVNCTHVIVSTACGSLREEIKPGDFVIIDQFIDRTTKREQTFYDGEEHSPKGILHLPMDTPFCSHTRQLFIDSCKENGFAFHEKGTMVTIEGPRFSSRSESLMFRQWGGDVINMTTCPEVVLARELKLCYAAIATATDYDCWKENDNVSIAKVFETFKKNSNNAAIIIQDVVKKIAEKDWNTIIKAMQGNVDSNIMGTS